MTGWLIYDTVGQRRNRWFIEQLVNAASKRDLDLRFVSASSLQAGIKDSKKCVFLDGKECAFPDFVVCRTIFPLLSEFFEAAGVKVFNSAEVSRICNDKRATHMFFADTHIPMADTVFWNRLSANPSALNYPCILKSAAGHGGTEIFRTENVKDFEMQMQRIDGGEILVQRPMMPGMDVRVYLLYGEVIFAALRSCDTDFRSNYSLGGKIAPYTPGDEMMSVIKTIQDRLSPFYVGIDFIFDHDGRPMLNEIEDVVGARMIYELTDMPLHELYIDRLIHALKHC